MELMEKLKQRKVKIGTATSVIKKLWYESEIYPSSNNPIYKISNNQIQILELFNNQNDDLGRKYED